MKRKAVIFSVGTLLLLGIGVAVWRKGSALPLPLPIISGVVGVSHTPTDIVDSKIIPNPSGGTYKDQSLRYSFEYGAGTTMRKMHEDEQGILVVRTDTGVEIQITETPFDEDIVLTTTRIKQDVPDIVIKNARVAKLDGATGLFFDTDTTRELWVVRAGFLYQISELRATIGILQGISDSWKWL